MHAIKSKNVLVYQQIRRALQSGRYAPGERLDPERIAAEFKISTTPVRLALHRLLGAGMLIDQARGEMRVPFPSETGMRELYDWMERLLLMACAIGVSMPKQHAVSIPFAPGDDVVKLTWQLFDQIAQASGHRLLHHAVKQTNDRLAPIRRAKHALIAHPLEELSALHVLWHRHDMPGLSVALHSYHQRRRQLVPRIVAALGDRRDSLH
jgi:DNA-binding GntR family transcriptional regulator